MRTTVRVLYATGGVLVGGLSALIVCGVLFTVLRIDGGFGLLGVLACGVFGATGVVVAWRLTEDLTQDPAAAPLRATGRRAGVLLAAAPSALLVHVGDWPAVLGGLGLVAAGLPFVLAGGPWFRHTALACSVAIAVLGVAFLSAYGIGLVLLATAALLALTGWLGSLRR